MARFHGWFVVGNRLNPKRLNTKRRSKRLEPRLKLYLVLEGEETEKQYLIRVGRSNRTANFEVVPITPGSARKTLFDKAASIVEKLKDEAELLNREESNSLGKGKRSKDRQHTFRDVGEVWVVCDVDQEGAELKSLLARRESREIRWIISNPSFEVWLGMHFDGVVSAYVERWDIQAELKRMKVLTGPNSKSIDMDALTGRYLDAKACACACAKRHENVTEFPQNNPSSDVHILVDRLNPNWQ